MEEKQLFSGNPTYTPTTLTKEEILDNHRSVLWSFGISTKYEELDLFSLYWIPKLQKCPFKLCYFDGSAKCSTKLISKLLTWILVEDNTGLLSYWDTSYSRGGSHVDYEALSIYVREHTI
jgi:hypothetical protein